LACRGLAVQLICVGRKNFSNLVAIHFLFPRYT
jgi:hypothetical protein